MKTLINLLTIGVLLLLCSCENNEVADPVAAVEVNKHQFQINESMIIHFTGSADQVVVFTGDDMHDYGLRSESNTGFVVNKGLFSYSYAQPGTYKVVCVASSYSDGAIGLKRDICSFTVSVVDDETEIEQLSCPQILYDEVFAGRLENDEWLMRLPRRVKYNNATPAISLSQRLRFYIQSDSTQVVVSNKQYAETDKYDLSSTLDIVLTSHFGTVRPYRLHTLYYPEFKSFKLMGVDGVIVRNEFDYSTLTLAITLPAGTDVSRLKPEFTTYSATDKVYIGDTEQFSETSEVNFTGAISYRLVSTLDGRAELSAETTLKVQLTYQ